MAWRLWGKGGGDGGNLDTAAEVVVPIVVVEPRRYTDQVVARMTPDQVRAASARGSLAAPQMQRRLGGEPLSNKELLRRLLAVAPIGASGGSSVIQRGLA